MVPLVAIQEEDGSLLPRGAHVDAYEIVDILGRGGFGITYRVFDPALDSDLALKEFFPSDMVVRDGSALKLLAKGRGEADYQWARRKFLDEARLLAQLEHPNIVKVRRVFEANNTVYMLLDFVPGHTLEAWLSNLQRPPTQEELDQIAGPLLSALELVHANETNHLDVAPDNILIRSTDGAPVLLDFGAARLEIQHRSQLVSAMLFKSGYSAPEQYTSSARRYGPWTDIYATGATLYRAISGQRPIEATERSLRDDLVPTATIGAGRYRDRFLRAIDAALRLPVDARPQTIAQWRNELLGVRPERSKAAAAATRILSRHETRLPGWALQAISAITSSADQLHDMALSALPWSRRTAGIGVALSAAVLFASYGVLSLLFSSGPRSTPNAPSAIAGQTPFAASPTLPPTTDLQPPPSTRPGRRVTLQVTLGALTSEPQKGWLDALALPITSAMAKSFGLLQARGAFVQDAAPNGQFTLAGGHAGDVILSVDGQDVGSPADLRRYIQSRRPGEKIVLGGWRFGTEAQTFKDVLANLVAQGDGQAMYWLGIYHFGSTLVSRNDAEAVAWLRRAGEAGDADAPFKLGTVIADGERVTRDLASARQLLAEAAKRGNLDGLVRLADVTAKMKSTHENAARQATTIRKSAEAGNVFAMTILARWYGVGYGLPKDEPAALRWYGRAAELGDADSYAEMALYYANGRAVPENDAQAVRLYRSAVAEGSLVALRHLAWYLDSGLGTERREPELAAELYLQGLASGESSALKFTSTISSKLSQEARTSMQRRLRDSGLYAGPLDGRVTDVMVKALRALCDRSERVPSNL